MVIILAIRDSLLDEKVISNLDVGLNPIKSTTGFTNAKKNFLAMYHTVSYCADKRAWFTKRPKRVGPFFFNFNYAFLTTRSISAALPG